MKQNWIKSLGPGLLFAGAAIGVSHLVQSTRAGADFGFGLLWALLLVNFFKYPFFQYGPRYATATGESLIDGYRRLGKGVLALYYILTFATMFTIQAAVTIVTSGLAISLFGFTDNVITWSIIITLVSFSILTIGKYRFLDRSIKIIIMVMAVSTIATVSIALFSTTKSFDFTQVFPKESLKIGFLIAFLGWMPGPLDISVWHSLWAIEKQKNPNKNFNTKQAVFDFNIGYIMTTFLAICFLILGALVMYQSGEEFSSSAGKFAQQIINLYTENLGAGLSILIAIAAFTTMFSTTLTTLDASPRAMAKSTELLFNKTYKFNYTVWMILLSLGTIIILIFFISNMMDMIKLATILSFLTAPFYAIANFMLISGKHVPKECRPSLPMKIISYLGIIFLLGFSSWYLMNL